MNKQMQISYRYHIHIYIYKLAVNSKILILVAGMKDQWHPAAVSG